MSQFLFNRSTPSFPRFEQLRLSALSAVIILSASGFFAAAQAAEPAPSQTVAEKSAAVVARETAQAEAIARTLKKQKVKLLAAILIDDAGDVQDLLNDGVDPNIREASRGPAIIMAVQEKSTKSLRKLLASPTLDIDAVNKRGETALMVAAISGSAETVSLLIAKGASVDLEGWSPLHYAASNGRNQIVKLLIEAGADINARSPNGTTPMMMAVRRGNLTPYQTLLLAGADPRMKNDNDLAVVDYLERNGETERAELLRNYSAGFKTE